MGQVARYDLSEVRKPERTPQGFLRADAVLTRSGVFVYRNPDGSIQREYRPPEEVFRADSLSSFEDAPLTRLHPSRLVDSKNARNLSVGSVKEAPRRDGMLAVSRIVVTDSDAIADVESGKLRAVSCGYTCDFDPTPGVTPDGERYDGIQKNIVGNHLALVPAGRAGPEATIRLDQTDAVMVTDDPEPSPVIRKDHAMSVKVRLDGVDFEASEQLAQAISVEQGKQKARLDELTAKVDELQKSAESEKARADAAKEDLEKARKDLEDAKNPAKVRERVDARIKLEREAAKILGEKDADGKEVKLDAMGDDEIRKAVILKVHPAAKERIDGADEAYISARYDAALEASEADDGGQRNDGLADVRTAANAATRQDAEKRIEKARQDAADAWRQPLATSKQTRAS